MSENSPANLPKTKLPKSALIGLAFICLAMTAYCVFGVVAWLKPDLIPLREEANIPSASATLQILEETAPPTPSKEAEVLIKSSERWSFRMEETFDSNDNDWNIGNVSTNDMDSNLEIKDGKYLWDVKSKTIGLYNLYPYALQPVSDFRLSADLKLTSGTYKPVYGVAFRDNPEGGNGYFFGIYGESFIVDKYFNDSFARIIEYVKSPAISPQESNRLTVIAKESYFVFLINDQFVGEMYDEDIKEGSVGLGVTFYHTDLQNSFEFDNFILQTP
jgi:hypothetical protein